ncbi:MAG: PRC-barrel domain-containing protein [Candidatus Buchananbacteria bacterium]
MIISSSEILNLAVYTQSEIHLGRISAFDLDADTGKIVTFYIKTGLIKGLWHQQLTVSNNQVISIDKDKMIVADTVKKQPILDLEPSKLVTE